MDVTSKREVTVNVALNEREAKILGCLIGCLSSKDAEEMITDRSLDFAKWINKFEYREMEEFCTHLYDSLHDLF